MFSTKRKLLSQNFLHSRKLVSQLVGHSSIGNTDVVVEIGPGKGIITWQLLLTASLVIAVEIDPQWYQYLQQEFRTASNLIVYNRDFLSYPLPKGPYKVFANIPFAIAGKIIRKLLEAANPPHDTYLVIQKELAYRLRTKHKENMFSLLYKPWFVFTIPYHFDPYDFTPVPSVQPVLFRFTKRSQPLLPMVKKQTYQKFVHTAFGQGQPIRQNLLRMFPSNQVDHTFHVLSIPKKTRPGQLKLKQWIRLYTKLAGQ